jgi:hypothetical protein
MDRTNSNRVEIAQKRGRPVVDETETPENLRKRNVFFWMKREMVDQLDRMAKQRGISNRGDLVRILIESHPDYQEARS